MNMYSLFTRFVDSLSEEQLDMMASLCKADREKFRDKYEFVAYCIDWRN